MATGNITIAANITGGPDGSWSLNTTFTAPSAVQGETVVALTVGLATIAVPSGATSAIIVPPNAAVPQPNPSWGGTLTLKGVSGDTGVAISNKYLTPLVWDTGNVPANIVLTSTATGTLYVRFM